LVLPDAVKTDVAAYRSRVDRFQTGDDTAVAFRAYRVPMGVYEQREAGHYMVRIRLGAGLVTSRQLLKIAELSRAYGDGTLHVTTRQDMQIHDVALGATPDVMEGLIGVGLSSRGGGGNTVRNVTACPRASTCPKAQFDVAPLAIAAAEYLLQRPSSFNLPRKYKIAFSGCGEDCAGASVADLGLFAKVVDGKRKLVAYAGGGLGMHPAVGVEIGEFEADADVLALVQAVKSFFDRHGDRSNKHRARLRYVVSRLGEAEFTKLLQAEVDMVKREGLDGVAKDPRPLDGHLDLGEEAKELETLPPNVSADATRGRYTIEIPLPLGDVSAADLERLARAASTHGVGVVVAAQTQNLMIPSVPGDRVAGSLADLSHVAGGSVANTTPAVTACTGAATCKLGMCLSRNLASALSKAFDDAGVAGKDVPEIRISGCPNNCGQHHAGRVGLQGGARRHHGRLMPVYKVLYGADMTQGAAKLATEVAEVPARTVPDLLVNAAREGALDAEGLKARATRYSELPADVPEEYYFDFGSGEPFSLSGRGPGECGAGVMDVIALDIRDATEAAQKAASSNDEAYRAIVTGARALLPVSGLEPRKDREVVEACRAKLVKPGWLAESADGLLAAALDWRLGDRDALTDLADDIVTFVDRVKTLFASLDASLKFRLEPLSVPGPTERAPAGAEHTKDLRGVACPMNFVKAKVALESIAVGETLVVLLDDGEPIKNVPASFADQGQDVLGVEKVSDHNVLRVRRTK
jgi:sulfite reductase (ferredoxin)